MWLQFASLAAAGLSLCLVATACSETGSGPPIVMAADTADQVAYGVTYMVTADGVLRSKVEADSSYFYERAQTYELFQVRVTFFASTGEESSTVTADAGTYAVRTGNMTAMSNVVGISRDGRRLETSVLSYDRTTNSLDGPEAFTLSCEGQQISGTSFTADPDFRNVQATGLRGPPCRGARSRP